MKSGYQAELSARKDELEQDKLELESLYMAPTKEEEIQESEEKNNRTSPFFRRLRPMLRIFRLR